MTDTGIIRTIDELNRITIPSELLKSIGWEKRSRLNIAVLGNKILLSATQPGDVGILRKLDKLNRITIPQEICTSFKFTLREPLRFAHEGNIVYLIPVLHVCFFCGEEESEPEEYLGVTVCRSCIEALARKNCV